MHSYAHILSMSILHLKFDWLVLHTKTKGKYKGNYKHNYVAFIVSDSSIIQSIQKHDPIVKIQYENLISAL